MDDKTPWTSNSRLEGQEAEKCWLEPCESRSHWQERGTAFQNRRCEGRQSLPGLGWAGIPTSASLSPPTRQSPTGDSRSSNPTRIQRASWLMSSYRSAS